MIETIFSNALVTIVLILVFGLTIFVHELGHFLAALYYGMVIDVFSIGMGPAIWKRKIRGVTYKIGWIPIGGYVALPQLDPTAMAVVQGGADKNDGQHAASDGGKPEGEQDSEQRELPYLSPWRKMVVSVAGAVGNVLLAVVLAWIIYLTPDVVTEGDGTIIGQVETNSVAYAKGLRAGDEILAVNGEKVRTWSDYTVLCVLNSGRTNEVSISLKSGGVVKDIVVPLREAESGINAVPGLGKAMVCRVSGVIKGSSAEQGGIKPKDIIRSFDGIKVISSSHFISLVGARPDKSIPLEVERNGKLLTLNVTPRYDARNKKTMIGIMFGEIFNTPWMQYKRPWDQIKNDALQIVRVLRALVTPHEAAQAAGGLGGPPIILLALWLSIKASFMNAMGFVRFLNVNLAIINLLPIPILDGGHIMFALSEAIRRKKANPKVVNVLVNVCGSLLIAAILYISARDIIVKIPQLLGFKSKKEKVELAVPGPAPVKGGSGLQKNEGTNAPGAGAVAPVGSEK